MVTNVANSYRIQAGVDSGFFSALLGNDVIPLQEECDVLSLVLAQYEVCQTENCVGALSPREVWQGPIILMEFKAVMLASLRSLVPKAGTRHASAQQAHNCSP